MCFMRTPTAAQPGFLMCKRLFFHGGQKGDKQWKSLQLQMFLQKNVDFFKMLCIIVFCMDTKKDDRIVQCDTMAEIPRNYVVVGMKQFRKALRDGRVLQGYLAENADPAVTEPLAVLCQTQGIPLTWVNTMAELGRACGIDVGAAAAATVKSL